MGDDKQPSVSVEKELGHQLAAEGDAVVINNVGNEADRYDMYRMGKVQQMQVSPIDLLPESPKTSVDG